MSEDNPTWREAIAIITLAAVAGFGGPKFDAWYDDCLKERARRKAVVEVKPADVVTPPPKPADQPRILYGMVLGAEPAFIHEGDGSNLPITYLKIRDTNNLEYLLVQGHHGHVKTGRWVKFTYEAFQKGAFRAQDYITRMHAGNQAVPAFECAADGLVMGMTYEQPPLTVSK